MALTITYEQPDFPKGTEFEIVGLGLVPNGEAVELTEEQEEKFVNFHGKTVKDALSDDPMIKITGRAHLTPSMIEEVEVSDTPEEGVNE